MGKELVRRPRVLVVCQHFWPETFRVNDIAEFLTEKNCDVEVLCGLPNYPRGKFFEGYSFLRNLHQENNGIEIHRAWEVPRGSNTNLRIFINYLSFPFFSLLHMPRLLFKKYDRIFIYQLSPVMMAITGLLLGKLKKIETTMYVLDLWPENLFSVFNVRNGFGRKMITQVSHWHYRRADKLVALSERMKERLTEVTGKAESKVIVLPQACEKLYEEDILDADLAKRFSGKFNILFTGNISPAQSFETILEAADRLKKEGLDDVRWVIVGDGMSKNWLVEEVGKRKLEDVFVFEGQKPVADMPRYTPIADVLVGCLVKSQLLEATIPAKVMSYLAAGRPMVLAMDGEARKLINETIKCGYAGPTADGRALADNIRKVHSASPAERAEMGKRARAYHFAHFERNLILNRLYDFIFS